MARPCKDGKDCSYKMFDWSDRCWICTFDFESADCPYVKSYGKNQTYEKQMNFSGGRAWK